MSNYQFARECIEKAVRTLSEDQSPAMVRQMVRKETERLLDQVLGTDHAGPRGGFPAYLKQQSESSLWNSEGDEAHDGDYYRAGAASCFFPVAAREIVKDGVDSATVANFCVEAALEALTTGGLSLEEREDKLMKIVLAYRISEEISGKAA